MQISAPAVELLDRLDDVGLLVFGELGVDGQRQRFLGRALRVRERARPIVEVLVADLQMQGRRVIDLGADSVLLQEGPELIPLRDADDVLVVDVAVLGGDRGQGHATQQVRLLE